MNICAACRYYSEAPRGLGRPRCKHPDTMGAIDLVTGQQHLRKCDLVRGTLKNPSHCPRWEKKRGFFEWLFYKEEEVDELPNL